jgi:hypothetical protein
MDAAKFAAAAASYYGVATADFHASPQQIADLSNGIVSLGSRV